MTARAPALGLALLAAALGCGHEGGGDPLRSPARVGAPGPAAPPPSRDPAVIRSWLECEECIGGELAAVVALGDAAVPMLRSIGREGLSTAGRAELRAALERHYAAQLAYGERHEERAPALSEAAYLRLHLGTRELLYRVRAIRGLGAIGSKAAERALRELLAEEPPAPLPEEIRRALGKTSGAPSRGTSTSAPE